MHVVTEAGLSVHVFDLGAAFRLCQSKSSLLLQFEHPFGLSLGGPSRLLRSSEAGFCGFGWLCR
jgi:hypothetical protein